jgi:hypothetical protein
MWRFVRDGSGGRPRAGEVVGIAYDPRGGWRRIDGSGNPWTPPEGFFDRHPIWGGIRRITVERQELVEIPAFYYRREHKGANQFALWISPQPAQGFQLHPAFRLNGGQMPALQVGAYEAVRDFESAGSVENVEPLTDVDFETMQQLCRRDGSNGFGLWSIYELAAIQMLVLIELGTPDVQHAIAPGNVHGRGPKPTGSTAAVWRGIHELWGNVLHMVDGLRHDADGNVRVWSPDGGDGWIDTALVAGGLNGVGWVDGFRPEPEFSAVLLPASIADDPEDATAPDLYIAPDRGRASVTYHGGGWGSGSQAGLFGLDCRYPASLSDTNVGGRLARRVL